MSIRNKIFARLDSLDIITSPPSVFQEILLLMDHEDPSASILSKAILKDPDLMARVLKVANSSFYGNQGQVKNIDQAIMILGQKMAKCIVMTMLIYDQVCAKDSGKEKEYVKLWQHFLEVASIARNIALGADYNSAEEAYIAGLLHDFGRLFLLRFFGTEVFRVNRLLKEGQFLIDAEKAVLGVDHQEIGEFIARRWNLPESIGAAMGYHHPRTGGEIGDLPFLSKDIVLADNLSSAGGEMPEHSGAATRAILIVRCASALGVDMTRLGTFYSSVYREVLGNAEGMNINLGDAVPYLSRINNRIFDLYIGLINVLRERQELADRLLKEEKLAGSLKSIHVALATLSHYINNVSMSIGGQCEVIKILYDSGDMEKVCDKIPEMTESIQASIKKISLITEELSKISDLGNIGYMIGSGKIDIEKSRQERIGAGKDQI